jgi:hypothetical protein
MFGEKCLGRLKYWICRTLYTDSHPQYFSRFPGHTEFFTEFSVPDIKYWLSYVRNNLLIYNDRKLLRRIGVQTNNFYYWYKYSIFPKFANCTYNFWSIASFHAFYTDQIPFNCYYRHRNFVAKSRFHPQCSILPLWWIQQNYSMGTVNLSTSGLLQGYWSLVRRVKSPKGQKSEGSKVRKCDFG